MKTRGLSLNGKDSGVSGKEDANTRQPQATRRIRQELHPIRHHAAALPDDTGKASNVGFSFFDGRAVISRRYAIDWKQIKDGEAFSCDNIPGHGESFHPAGPITMETVAGNTITLDLGGGQFAYYIHLQPEVCESRQEIARGAARCWRASALPVMPRAASAF
jgi:hypothetical protein